MFSQKVIRYKPGKLSGRCIHKRLNWTHAYCRIVQNDGPWGQGVAWSVHTGQQESISAWTPETVAGLSPIVDMETCGAFSNRRLRVAFVYIYIL